MTKAPMSEDLEVDRGDLRRTRIRRGRVPVPTDRQCLCRVERVALTANTVTYAVAGETLGYWRFFPATEQPWGRVPAWGYAEVVDDRTGALTPGERLYGYWPIGSHVLLTPAGVTDGGFTDASPHRADLPAVYNAYRRAGDDDPADAHGEAVRMLLWPLFVTAFLLEDELGDHDDVGARQVVLSSASSKTAIAIALRLQARGSGRPDVVGLTAAANVAFVERTGAYDQVLAYDDLDRLDPDVPTAYVDMAGNAAVRAAVHRHLGDRLVRSTLVGITHWDRTTGDTDLPGPRPAFFFAPDRSRRRIADWGADGFAARTAAAWAELAATAGRWLAVEERHGLEEARAVYLDTLDGRVPPDRGIVVRLRPDATAPSARSDG